MSASGPIPAPPRVLLRAAFTIYTIAVVLLLVGSFTRSFQSGVTYSPFLLLALMGEPFLWDKAKAMLLDE